MNGPGEAREVDLGVAAGRGNGMIYREGKAIRRVSEAEIVPALLEEIERFVADKATRIVTSPNQVTAQPAPTTFSPFPILK